MFWYHRHTWLIYNDELMICLAKESNLWHSYHKNDKRVMTNLSTHFKMTSQILNWIHQIKNLFVMYTIYLSWCFHHGWWYSRIDSVSFINIICDIPITRIINLSWQICQQILKCQDKFWVESIKYIIYLSRIWYICHDVFITLDDILELILYLWST